VTYRAVGGTHGWILVKSVAEAAPHLKTHKVRAQPGAAHPERKRR
jgi:hypothetical protein